jgi:hypothetical protein
MIKAMIDGIVDIVKLIIILYALYYTVDSGLLECVINMFK